LGRCATAVAPLALVTACQGSQSVLDPAGPADRTINHLWWAMLIVASAIWLAVVVAAFWATISRRRVTREDLEPLIDPPEAVHRRHAGIFAGLVGATAIVLLVFLIYDFTVGRALAAHPMQALTIELIGHQWWWEVHFDDPDPSKVVVDANELHIPAGQPVQIKVTSRDVIHSFWVPNFLYKRDVIPGLTNRFELTPSRIGTYKGKCAELCGAYHSRMLFNVKVVSQQDYQAELQQLRSRGQVGLYQAEGRRRTGSASVSEPQENVG
jgi:cytochrome c oxidase subunit 2